MPNARGGKGTGFGGAASAGRDASSSSRAARSADTKGSASSGRPGGVGNVGQTNSMPTTTSYGAPIHYDNSNNPVTRGITLAAGPALNQQNIQRTDLYNDAARKWNESAQKRSLANLVNALSPMGLSMEPPDVKRPSTFSEGDYHLGWNPGSLLGLGGVMGPPGLGTVLGAAGQAGYTALGGKNVMLGGSGDMGMPTWNNPGTQTPFGQGAMTPGGGQNADRTGMGQNGVQHLQNLAQLNQGVSGNPNAPQSIGGTAGGTQIQGPNYANMLASTRQVTPDYGVQLPGYQYRGRATV